MWADFAALCCMRYVLCLCVSQSYGLRPYTLTHYHKASPTPAFPEAPPTAPSASKQLMNKMESSVGEWLRLVFSHVHFPMFVVAFSKCYVVLNSTLWLHLELI